jgi:hypothetical protein
MIESLDTGKRYGKHRAFHVALSRVEISRQS